MSLGAALHYLNIYIYILWTSVLVAERLNTACMTTGYCLLDYSILLA